VDMVVSVILISYLMRDGTNILDLLFSFPVICVVYSLFMAGGFSVTWVRWLESW